MSLLSKNQMIDWLSLSQNHTDELEHKQQKINIIQKLIETKLHNFTFDRINTGSKQVYTDSLCKSIRILVNSKFTQLQFKGTFFVLHPSNSFRFIMSIFCRESHQRLTWHVTRIDIKRDFQRSIEGLLPIHHKQYRQMYDPNLFYTYRSGLAPQNKNSKKGPTFRPFPGKNNQKLEGYSLSVNGRWKLIVYDKKNEIVRNTKNLYKRKALFEHLDHSKPLTRVELRLDGRESCILATKLFQDDYKILTESMLCKEVTKRWLSKRRFYKIENSSDTLRKNSSLKDEPRWSTMFNPQNEKYQFKKIVISSTDGGIGLQEAKKYLRTGLRKLIEYNPRLEVNNDILVKVWNLETQRYRKIQNSIDKAKDSLLKRDSANENA